MIEIISWFNVLHDVTLPDLFDFIQSIKMWDTRVCLVEPCDPGYPEQVIVVWRGDYRISNEGLIEAFKKAWDAQHQ